MIAKMSAFSRSFFISPSLLLLNDFKLDINFYHDKKIYWYKIELVKDVMTNVFIFKNESIHEMPYKKSKVKYLDDISKYKPYIFKKELPDDTSSLFYLLKNRNNFATCFYGRELPFSYKAVSFIYDKAALNINYLNILLKLFDSNIASIHKIGDSNYEVNLLDGRTFKFNNLQLENYLSSGTSKGLLLYTAMIKILKDGGTLLIDEIENHFHRTLVDNIIDLFKDPSVNKHGASIIFTTHYPELLDLFNRSDNIWITKQDQKIFVENMYQKYGLRSELSKSKKFYQNAFDTAVNYEVLMALKKELINNG